jgi:hypothetical protein
MREKNQDARADNGTETTVSKTLHWNSVIESPNE